MAPRPGAAPCHLPQPSLPPRPGEHRLALGQRRGPRCVPSVSEATCYRSPRATAALWDMDTVSHTAPQDGPLLQLPPCDTPPYRVGALVQEGSPGHPYLAASSLPPQSQTGDQTRGRCVGKKINHGNPHTLAHSIHCRAQRKHLPEWTGVLGSRVGRLPATGWQCSHAPEQAVWGALEYARTMGPAWGRTEGPECVAASGKALGQCQAPASPCTHTPTRHLKGRVMG